MLQTFYTGVGLPQYLKKGPVGVCWIVVGQYFNWRNCVQYLAVSLVVVALFSFLGYGLSNLLCFGGVKKYAALLSPLIGYCYLTLAGWYCYRLTGKGTDTYWPVVFILPTLLLIPAVYKFVKRTPENGVISKDQIFALLLGGAMFLLISAPCFLSHESLTSVMSLGNYDIADSASIATFLKESPGPVRPGFMGAPNNVFVTAAEKWIFGGPLFSAFSASVLSLQTYQIQTMSVNLFGAFGLLMLYLLAREGLGYSVTAALGVTGMTGLSSLFLYSLHQGFQGQTIAMALVNAIFFINIYYSKTGKGTAEFFACLFLNSVLGWGLSMTYSHAFFIVYGMIFLYLLAITAMTDKEKGLRGIGAILGALIVVCVLSPARARLIIEMTIQKSGETVGWFKPLYTPDMIFGLAVRSGYLVEHSLIMKIILSIPIIGIGLMSLKKAFGNGRDIFAVLCCVVFPLSGYILLSYSGRTSEGWGGYGGFKIISLFLPLLFVGTFYYFKDLTLKWSGYKEVLAACAFLGMVFLNGISAYSMTRDVLANKRPVTREMAELKKLETRPDINSINVRGNDWWEILWATNFLMKKSLYFETSTYGGREASELKGEWDLLEKKGGLSNQAKSSREQIIVVNDRYILGKRAL